MVAETRHRTSGTHLEPDGQIMELVDVTPEMVEAWEAEGACP